MKKYISAVSFELTRRCNMKCEFCAKGEAQNKDTTEAVINKALDELEGFKVHTIRAGGGEPMLNKKGLIYLIDEIIRRNFKLCHFLVFTNGTVQDAEIKTALVRIGEHCKKCVQSEWGRDISIWTQFHYTKVYEINSYVSLIISTDFHDNSDIVYSTMDFYNEGVDPEILSVVNQTDSIIEPEEQTGIVLEGSAEKNLQELYRRGFRRFNLYNNKFSPIEREDDNFVAIQKTLNVCVNGNVTAGCTQSYEHADSEYICNIFECSGNLYDYVNAYSWKYPLNRKQAEHLIILETWLYLYDKGINMFPDDAVLEEFRIKVQMMKAYAELIKEVHQKYKTMFHVEAQELAALILAHEHTADNEREIQRYILKYYFGNENMTNGDIATAIQFLLTEHRLRALQDNALFKGLNKLF